jgi:hypothetical protein
MQTDRAVDLALSLLVPGLVDWAQLALRDGPALRCRALLAGGTVQHASVAAQGAEATLLERVMARGLTDLTLVPPHEPDSHSDTLASAVPDPTLRETVAAIRPVDLLVIPLAARGRTFGTLTLARKAGAGFDAGAVSFLEDLAQGLASTIDATRMLADSRRVAAVLSRDLAPPNLPGVPGARLASYYRVAFEHEALGGDFYDIHGGDDDWTVVVGDVCGKGVEAAVLTGRVRQAVRTAALVDRSPAKILDLVNRALVSDGDGTFVTAVCARVRHREEGLDVSIAAAGHPQPFVLREQGDLERVPAKGTVLGLFESEAYTGYEEVHLRLGSGDSCLFFTDGVVEAPGFEDRFGEERLEAVLAGGSRSDVNAIVETVAVALSDHLGDRAHDDIAILGIQSTEAP